MKHWNESKLQQPLLRQALEKQCIAVPNTKAIWGRLESDIIVLTKSCLTCEIEIKCSRSDFKADFKKTQKHKRLKSGNCPINKFFYACPTGMIEPNEIPSYAGLIYVSDDYTIETVIKAPTLNKSRISRVTTTRLFRSLAWKLIQ